MDVSDAISDDETILRHVPGGTTFQAPGPRITRKNFELREDRGESGLSVSRESITSANALMARIGNPDAGSRIIASSVAAIRALGLDVVPAPIDCDTGHAEIRSATASLNDKIIRQQLAALFQFVT